jgi:DNA polymerase
MRTLGIDLETYSAADIKSVGAFRYAYDPSFEILLFGYSIDGAPALVADLAGGEPIPQEVLNALYDPEVVKTGWNNAFERVCLHRALGRYLPPEQWEDTMVLAATCGLPLSLDAACRALRMPEDKAKMQEGRTLIQYFCKPYRGVRHFQNDAPERWKTFKKYCARDVDSEGDIRQRLIRFRPDETEHKFWCLDARINERGVRIDRQLAVNAVAMDERYRQELTERAVALTGLENPRSVSQIKTWLADQEGKTFPSLNKKVIAEVVSSLRSDKAREFMAIRSELSKSSTAKYQAMLRSMCSDDHSKGCFQFYGANRTGRFAGRLVQFQNMSKNYAEDLDGMRRLVRDGHYTALKAVYDGIADPLSQLVRTAIIPEEGHRILVADFSAIEARVTAWFAGEEWRLQTFRDGGDIYCASASQMFHVPVVKHGVNGELRQKGKVAELALGYGGGVNALKAFGADKMGMSDEEMQETVDLWRESSPKIVELWRALEKAAIRCVARNVTTESSLGHVRFDMEQGILWMTLPSGRRLAYVGAKYEESKYHPDRKSLTYMGVEQQTRHWGRLETWGGKLVENLVQATARDILREAMFSLTEQGFDIRAHVHDECICTEPIGGKTVEQMCAAMCPVIPWATGLPLRAEGYEGQYYFKD